MYMFLQKGRSKHKDTILPLDILPAKALLDSSAVFKLHALITTRFLRLYTDTLSSEHSESFQYEAQKLEKEITINNNGLHFRQSAQDYKRLGWREPSLCLLPDLMPCSLPRGFPERINVGDKVMCLLPLKMKVGLVVSH